jgi:hypothetical protein
MDSSFWNPFIAGVCILQAVYSMVLGHTGWSIFEAALSLGNIFVYMQKKDLEDTND